MRNRMFLFLSITICLFSVDQITAAQVFETVPSVQAQEKTDKNPIFETEPLFEIAQMMGDPLQTRVYKLGPVPANQIEQIIKNSIPEAKTAIDERNNQLIFSGTPAQIKGVERILQHLVGDQNYQDTPTNTPLPSNIAYRVYAVEVPLEIPSEQFMRQQFTVVLKAPGKNVVMSTSLLESSLGDGIQINELNCIHRDEGYIQFDISGTVFSSEAFPDLIATFEELIEEKVEIVNMRFNKIANIEPPQSSGFDNAFYHELDKVLNPSGSPRVDSTITESDTGNASHLSKHSSLRSVKKTLNNLLGDSLRVRGYWFGNSSLPGQCTATVGSWVLEINTWSPIQTDAADMNAGMGGMMGGMGMGMGGMSMGGMGMGGGMMGRPAPSNNPSNEKSEFTMEINLNEEEQTILSNNVNARIGRPVIVGYTRNTLGQYVPGALVVIPEFDFFDGSK